MNSLVIVKNQGDAVGHNSKDGSRRAVDLLTVAAEVGWAPTCISHHRVSVLGIWHMEQKEMVREYWLWGLAVVWTLQTADSLR